MTNLDPGRDDERFKNYLRQFQPLKPDTLPAPSAVGTPRPRRLILAWSAVAMITMAGSLLIRWQSFRNVQMVHQVPSGEMHPTAQTLTVASANMLLADSPAAQAALDRATFHGQLVEPRKGKQSALAVLGKATERL
jgi:hypothetical protein